MRISILFLSTFDKNSFTIVFSSLDDRTRKSDRSQFFLYSMLFFFFNLQSFLETVLFHCFLSLLPYISMENKK